jgi:hypothetical protein
MGSKSLRIHKTTQELQNSKAKWTMHKLSWPTKTNSKFHYLKIVIFISQVTNSTTWIHGSWDSRLVPIIVISLLVTTIRFSFSRFQCISKWGLEFREMDSHHRICIIKRIFKPYSRQFRVLMLSRKELSNKFWFRTNILTLTI